MITFLLLVLVIFLIAALTIAGTELHSGYMGDSSMLPGCLIGMIIVLAVIVVCGIFLGKIGFWIN